MNKLVCKFCGNVKTEICFAIGACGPKSAGKEWCMVEGTGKMACPDCYEKAIKEDQAKIKRHVENYNSRIKNE